MKKAMKDGVRYTVSTDEVRINRAFHALTKGLDENNQIGTDDVDLGAFGAMEIVAPDSCSTRSTYSADAVENKGMTWPM